MAKTPTQHCVHPGRHASHSPLRRTASVSAASTIWISLRSSFGSRRAGIGVKNNRFCEGWTLASLQMTGVAEIQKGSRPLSSRNLRSDRDYVLIEKHENDSPPLLR